MTQPLKFDSTTENRPFLSQEKLTTLLDSVPDAKMGVIGDFCLDVYWELDESKSEVSVETGLATRPVCSQKYTLGGAGNVVCNLRALGCGQVEAFGVIGDDPWGAEMRKLLHETGAGMEGMQIQREGWSTLTYIKPHKEKEEENRIDFGNFNVLSDACASELLDALERAMPSLDILIVNQQILKGVHSKQVREKLSALLAAHPGTRTMVDSRHFSDAYSGAGLKVNEHEAVHRLGEERDLHEQVPREDVQRAAEYLWSISGQPVFITRGERGMIVRDSTGIHEVSGLQILDQIDVVGAGDSALAGIAVGLATGARPVEAAELGGLVASVTVRKLRQTGTATPEEVREAGREPDYIYRPDLAVNPGAASFYPGSEIEKIRPVSDGFRVTHAIFDHDGTLSTLREGWEEVMEPFMMTSILGSRQPDEILRKKLEERIREFIEKTTGIQTLVQMAGLVELVREFGLVPSSEILTPEAYKAGYNEALMRRVAVRMEKLRNGQLSVEDFSIKNAVCLLEVLRDNGVSLYLASGTDEPDVKAEAEAMGYAHFFENRIYGAVGNIAREAKREVLDRILSNIGEEAATGLVTFGDGPVEIRETRRRGGLAVGLASDEVRRFGHNPAKRTRLIRAGADMIISDFSELPQILERLGLAPETPGPQQKKGACHATSTT